ncbi:hypothetical protein BDF22DRAFT_71751 [Syncephalis plumigaleata]|nr:hypothetical protein BDF22DRAFT_71751 [Syncephalis plumigaleata]
MNGRQSSIACGVTRTNHILRRLSTLGLFGCGASSVHGATSSNNNNNNNNSNKVNGFVEFALALRQSTNQMDENASHAALHQLVTGSQSVTLILNSTRSLSKGYQLSTDRTSKRTNSSSNNNNSVRIAKNTSRRLYRRSRQPRLGQTKPTSPYVRRLVPHCFLRLGLGCTRRLGGHKSGHRRSKKRADIQRETGRVAAKQTHTYLSASRNADYSMSGLMDITPTLNTSVIAANTPLSSKTRQSDKAQRLPVEIVVAILSRLHRPKDIRVAQLTCRLWYDSAKTALANLRRRFPYAGMSILESLR